MAQLLNSKFEDSLEHPFAYELDDFQKHSIHIMNTVGSSNILITAHPGSGKSLPAEYAILRGHSIGKKVIYLSPIKTLSNQKYYEFTHKYPHISVGIITGDNKHNPMADVLIMTNEILQNLLLNKKLKVNEIDFCISMDEVYCVIFDEVHYINNPERGSVIEKCIMALPKHITILMLSATIEKPLDFLNWVHTCNENPSYLLTNEKRVVPLVFHYGIFAPKIPKEMLHQSKYINEINHLMDLSSKKIEEEKMNKLLQLTTYYQNISRPNLKWLITECANELYKRELCPAIFFVFSKKNCMNLANSIEMSFNDIHETIQVEHDIEYYLSKTSLKDEYKKTAQYATILNLAKKGIAVHHSGLIPIFKEIIELLFTKHLIKVLFATETFSVGLNMPTKTVVFTDVYKFDNNGKRILLSHEFIQMSGRAGRRGLDKIGHVVLLPQIFSQEITKLELNGLLLGKSQMIESKFYVDEKLILDFIKNNPGCENKLDSLADFVKRSLLATEMDKRKKFLMEEIRKQEIVVATTPIPDRYEEYLDIHEKLNCYIQPSSNQKKKLLAQMKEMEKIPNFKKMFDIRSKVVSSLESLIDELKFLVTNVTQSITNIINNLESGGYFCETGLTTKGQISLQFSEMEAIPGAEIIYSGLVEKIDEEQWIVLLTLLTDGRNTDEFDIPKNCKDIYIYLDTFKLKKELNKQYVYPVLDWYNGKEMHAICTDDDVFEGDLIKIVNKIINFIDEFINGFLLKNNLEMVKLLEHIRENLKREVISNESLYLKLS